MLHGGGRGGGSEKWQKKCHLCTALTVFLFVFKWCNRDLRCKKLQLTDLLVSPVHHIMKIPLVVKDIETRTEDPEEKAVISKILEVKESSLSKLLLFFIILKSFITEAIFWLLQKKPILNASCKKNYFYCSFDGSLES